MGSRVNVCVQTKVLSYYYILLQHSRVRDHLTFPYWTGDIRLSIHQQSSNRGLCMPCRLQRLPSAMHVEAGLVQKFYILPLSMPVMTFTCPLQSEVLVVSGQWELMQWHASHQTSPQKTATNCWSRQVQTHCSTPMPIQHCGWSCTVQYGLSWPCRQDGGHPVLWSHYVVQYLLVSAYDPLLSTGSLVPYTHNCRSSMPCTSRNVKVWQTCFQETNHSAPFECNHLLILHAFASTRTNKPKKVEKGQIKLTISGL